MGRGLIGSILSIVYVVVGVIVADSHKYFVHLANLKIIVSAILAVVLWPLLLVGVSLHIK
jgi:flagellar motor component MotA